MKKNQRRAVVYQIAKDYWQSIEKDAQQFLVPLTPCRVNGNWEDHPESIIKKFGKDLYEVL